MGQIDTQDPFLEAAKRKLGGNSSTASNSSDPFLEAARRKMVPIPQGPRPPLVAAQNPPYQTPQEILDLGEQGVRSREPAQWTPVDPNAQPPHFTLSTPGWKPRTAAEPFGQRPPGAPPSTDELLGTQTTQRELDKMREAAITAEMQQPTERDIATTAGSMSYPQRAAIAGEVAMAHTIGTAVGKWQQATDPATGGVLGYALGKTQGTMPAPDLSHAERMQAEPLAAHDPVTQFVAGLPAMVPGFADPDAAVAMILSHVPSGLAMNNPATAQLLQGVTQKYGPTVGKIVERQLHSGIGLAGFSTAHASIGGEGDPAELTKIAGQGFLTGQAFGLPGSLGEGIPGLLAERGAKQGRQAASDAAAAAARGRQQGQWANPDGTTSPSGQPRGWNDLANRAERDIASSPTMPPDGQADPDAPNTANDRPAHQPPATQPWEAPARPPQNAADAKAWIAQKRQAARDRVNPPEQPQRSGRMTREELVAKMDNRQRQAEADQATSKEYEATAPTPANDARADLTRRIEEKKAAGMSHEEAFDAAQADLTAEANARLANDGAILVDEYGDTYQVQAFSLTKGGPKDQRALVKLTEDGNPYASDNERPWIAPDDARVMARRMRPVESAKLRHGEPSAADPNERIAGTALQDARTGEIIPGGDKTHGLIVPDGKYASDYNAGFVTDKGRFVDRTTAMQMLGKGVDPENGPDLYHTGLGMAKAGEFGEEAQARTTPEEPQNVPQPEEAVQAQVQARPDALHPERNDRAGDAGEQPAAEGQARPLPAQEPETAPARVLSEKQPKGKPLTRQSIEKTLIDRHEAVTGGYERGSSTAQGGGETDYGAGTGSGTRVFYKRYPGEITDEFPTEKERQAVGLSLSDQRHESGAEDYAYDIGWDNYIKELRGDNTGAKTEAAKKFFRKFKDDPEAQFLTALHDQIPKGGKLKNIQQVKAKLLKAGDTFTVNGTEVRVEDAGDGNQQYLVLKDGDELPTTPIEALETVPMDKGSMGKAGEAVGYKASPTEPATPKVAAATPDVAPAKAPTNTSEAKAAIQAKRETEKPAAPERKTRQQLIDEFHKAFNHVPFMERSATIALADQLQRASGEGKDEWWSKRFAEFTDRPVKNGEDALHQDGAAHAPQWYSKLRQTVEQKMGGSMDANALRSMLTNAGVKPEEMEWSRVGDLSGKVTKQQVLDHLDEHAVKVEEVEKGDDFDTIWKKAKAKANDALIDAETFKRAWGQRKNYSGEPGTFPYADFFEDKPRQKVLRDLIEPLIGKEKARGTTKFGQYQLPGGENYRELLLTMPKQKAKLPEGYKIVEQAKRGSDESEYFLQKPDGSGYKLMVSSREEAQSTAEYILSNNGTIPENRAFTASHWDEPNVLAHIRFNDRTIDGKKVLFIEEIQSDWHQKGREQGYDVPTKKITEADLQVGKNLSGRWAATDPNGMTHYGDTRAEAVAEALRAWPQTAKRGVPNAPFKKNWHELAMKRAIRYAAENGYDRVAWTPGDIQNERYDLSKQVDSIRVGKDKDGTYWFDASKNGRSAVNKASLAEGDLADHIGKDLAKRAIDDLAKEDAPTDDFNPQRTYKGVDLQLGGSGMRGFYDDILPKSTDKIIKKWGGKVERKDAIEGGKIQQPNVEPFTDGDWDTFAGAQKFPKGEDPLSGETRLKVDGVETNGTLIADADGLAFYTPDGEWVRMDWPSGTGARKSQVAAADLVRIMFNKPDGPLWQNFVNQSGKEANVRPAATNDSLAHGFDITPSMREEVLSKGQPLFQGGKRGAVQFLEDGRAIVHAFSEADVSTGLHEIGHVLRRNLPAEEQAKVDAHYGIESGKKWEREQEERYAEDWERYTASGKAPTPELQPIFDRMREWLVGLYQRIKSGILGKNLSDEMREHFDRMLVPKNEREAKAALEAKKAAEPPPKAEEPPAPPETKAEPKAKAEPGEPNAIGLNKAEQDRFRKETGLSELPDHERRGWEEVLETAKREGHADRALETAAASIKSGEGLTDVEHAGAVLKAAELANRYDDAVERIAKLTEAGADAGTIKSARALADTIMEQIDLLTDATRQSRREIARALGIGRMMVNRESFKLADVVKRATEARGEKLSTAQHAQLESLTRLYKIQAEKLAETEKLAAKQKVENEKLRAGQAVRRAAIRGEAAARTDVKRQRLKIKENDILNDLRKIGVRTNEVVGASAEALYHIGRLALVKMEQGALTLEEVVNKVREHVPDITDQEVYRAINAKDPKRQAKAKTETQAKIADLKTQARLLDQIKQAENGVLSTAKPKGKGTTSAEVKMLRDRLTELRSLAYKTIERADPLEKAIKAINELQDNLANHTRALKKPTAEAPADLAALRKKAADLRKQMRTEDTLADLQQQLDSGDFKQTVRPFVEPISPEMEKAQIAVKKARRDIRMAIEEMRPKSIGQKIETGLNFMRTMKATADVSYALRQGAALSARRPVLAVKTFGQAFQTLFSEHKAEQIDNAIRNSPNQYLRDRAGLYLAELGKGPIKGREEAFMSNLAEKIPIFGKVVAASERNMVTGLNLLRAAAFDGFVEKHPNATRAELEAWADYVNKASGRGNMGPFVGASRAVATVIFAPRFAVSRFQTPLTLLKNIQKPRVRAEIAKDMAAFYGTGLTVLSLAALAGAKVGTNPRDPDFGKIVIGDTHIDIWAGFQQPIRLIAGAVANLSDRTGLTTPEFHSEQVQMERYSPLEAAARFASYKLAPSASVLLELWTGRDITGQPTSTTKTLATAAIPLLITDTAQAYQQSGLGSAALAAIGSGTGMGVSTYPPSEAQTRKEYLRTRSAGNKAGAERIRLQWNREHPDNQISPNFTGEPTKKK